MSFWLKARYLFLASLVVGMAFIAPATRGLQTAGCVGCARHGQVGEVKSPDWMPTEKDKEEVSAILLPGAKLQPGARVPYIIRESIWYRLAEQLTADCFHMRHYNDSAPAEYLFTADLSRTGPGDGDWRLVLNLFYDGTPREIVGTWTTTGSPGGCLNRMFKNDDAEVKRLKPIEATLLNDFEKRPHACDIRLSKEEVMPGETVDVAVENIRDNQGRTSREFNRIVVQAKEGEIMGGVKLESDPSQSAFKAGNGKVFFIYKRPDSCDLKEDTITIYNSCNIYREDVSPLAKTELKDKIGEKKIKLSCADVTFRVTATAKWEQDSKTERSVSDAKAIIEGTMKLDRKAPVSGQETYEVDQMSCRYEYLRRTLDKKPRQGCPELISEITASDQPKARPTRSTNYLRVTLDRNSKDSASIKLSLDFEAVQGRMKRRKTYYSPGCREYKTSTIPIPASVHVEAESKVEKSGIIVGRISRGFAPGSQEVLPVFSFDPIMGQMFPGHEMTIEWQIARHIK
jgi:hypothetical protein